MPFTVFATPRQRCLIYAAAADAAAAAFRSLMLMPFRLRARLPLFDHYVDAYFRAAAFSIRFSFHARLPLSFSLAALFHYSFVMPAIYYAADGFCYHAACRCSLFHRPLLLAAFYDI